MIISTFTPETVRKLFIESELDPLNGAHAYGRHIGVTNAQMDQREMKGELVAVTAFVDSSSAYLIGTELLNSPIARQGVSELLGRKDGTRLVVTYKTPIVYRVRYTVASRTMMCEWFRMVIDRDAKLSFGFRGQTFFPLIAFDPKVGYSIS